MPSRNEMLEAFHAKFADMAHPPGLEGFSDPVYEEPNMVVSMLFPDKFDTMNKHLRRFYAEVGPWIDRFKAFQLDPAIWRDGADGGYLRRAGLKSPHYRWLIETRSIPAAQIEERQSLLKDLHREWAAAGKLPPLHRTTRPRGAAQGPARRPAPCQPRPCSTTCLCFSNIIGVSGTCGFC